MYSFTISLLSAFAGLMTVWWPWKTNLIVCCTGVALPASDWRGRCLNGSLCHKNCTCGSSLCYWKCSILSCGSCSLPLTSTEFSWYVCMYVWLVCMYVCMQACMHVCMYVCIQSIAEMLYCRWSPFIHYMQHFLGVVFSVFAIKCYINVAVVWILQLKNKHKYAYK